MTETNENEKQVNSGKELNPIEEARALNIEMKDTLVKLQEERQLIEKTATEMALTGRSLAGETPKEITQDEIDQAGADKFLNLMK